VEIKSNYKIWLEYNNKPLLGEGRYALLKAIGKTDSLKKATELLKLNYKTAFNYINKIESRLGEKVILTHKGGKNAGGYTKLTSLGRELVEKYEKAVRGFI